MLNRWYTMVSPVKVSQKCPSKTKKVLLNCRAFLF
nr:MAG TPA: hypothetical protein [Caudoviricetes sp.]